MDPFAALFAHAAPRARTFFTGTLCKTVQYPDVGHLHFLKGGKLTLVQIGQSDLRVDEPTLLFFPRGQVHSFVVNPERGADLVCATVELGGAEGNPIGQGLPELVVLPLASHPALAAICDLLVGEAFSEQGGRQEALDRLFDYLLTLIGQTPMDYLTVWRMTIACQLLARGKPVKSVALQVGYQSAAAFSRVFSRVTGQAPRGVRE